tara:strand:+ start:299 stop:559 length:261 start_codon:yes stop_codon:yes gene_type:complete
MLADLTIDRGVGLKTLRGTVASPRTGLNVGNIMYRGLSQKGWANPKHSSGERCPEMAFCFIRIASRLSVDRPFWMVRAGGGDEDAS